MKKHEAEKLIAVIRELSVDVLDIDKSAKANLEPFGRRAGTTPLKGRPLDDNGAIEFSPAPENGRPKIDAPQLERIYAEIKKRLLDELPSDPIFLQLLANRPEIVLELQPRVVTLDGSTMKGRVAKLIAGGWFNDAKTTGGTRREMARTGSDPGGGGNLSTALSALVKDGFLTNEGDGYQKAPGIKITEKVLEAVL